MSIQHKLQVAMIGIVAPLLASNADAGDLSIGFGARIGGRARIQVSYHKSHYKHPVHRHHPRRCAPQRIWVPGHYETVREEVWVPESYEKVWIEPVYQTCHDVFGRPYRVLVRAGHWESVCTPGHYTTRGVRVWEPGYWRTTYACY